MNLKVLVLISLLITNIFGTNFKASQLTKKDIKTLKMIKKQGQRYGLSYSLMAIAIKESSIGRYVINSKSEDYGLFQANIKTVISRQKVKDNSLNRSIYAQKLINDVGFATANAIIELQYWQKVHKGSWFKTWSSYNTGWKYKSNTGINYAKSIFEIIKKLKVEYRL